MLLERTEILSPTNEQYEPIRAELSGGPETPYIVYKGSKEGRRSRRREGELRIEGEVPEHQKEISTRGASTVSKMKDYSTAEWKNEPVRRVIQLGAASIFGKVRVRTIAPEASFILTVKSTNSGF